MIVSHPVAGHVILIDDAREFVGTRDYPTVEQVRQLVAQKHPGAAVEIIDDIIRITNLAP
jgi:hypothetical protein